ncbi:CotS family spore coat protein [Geosporobacter ferrireducens]|uniref:CotS family spore coat protein n=1 Tax=Geosporobacter ferrireducens TaxID=1424294 RepID=UPI00139B2E1A|nr:CotS family spore coat protein [Geosporobacter ferrireducens]MTI57844.1 CotS family spore coat protein [Geosporobacter ferrireducens]
MNSKLASSDLNVLAKKVLLNYRLAPAHLVIIQNEGLKTLWKFKDKEQTFCLKRLRHSIDKAAFTVNAQIHIYNNQGKVPKIYLNKDNEPITEHEEQLFVLYEWIEGRDLNFSLPSDLAIAIKGLANFHLASKGYTAPDHARISSKLENWPNQYESMAKRLEKWREEAVSKQQMPSFQAYLSCIDEMLEIANMAIEEIKKSSYEKLTGIPLQECTLCHQDYGEGNVIYSNDILYVIDLDSTTYDLPLRDLRKIIGKQMQNLSSCNEEKIMSILKWYEEVNPLSQEYKKILIIDLMYPHGFFGAVKDIFKKSKAISSSKIKGAATFERKKLQLLKNLLQKVD